MFASDALSSVAYAPDEVFLDPRHRRLRGLLLLLEGRASPSRLVMLVVVASYRQNVHAYPSGGGDYEVATVNLGATPGLTVASALLVDYVLTVAVSISSAAQYAASTIDVARRATRSTVAVVAVVLLMAANLRGVRESGTAFAVPTYAFMAAVLGMAAWGFFRLAFGRPAPASRAHMFDADGRGPVLGRARRPGRRLPAAAGLLVRLRGADRRRGDQQRRPRVQKPKSKNAATTLLLLGTIAVTMMLSIIVLAKVSGLRFAEDEVDQLRLNGEKGVPPRAACSSRSTACTTRRTRSSASWRSRSSTTCR